MLDSVQGACGAGAEANTARKWMAAVGVGAGEELGEPWSWAGGQLRWRRSEKTLPLSS